MLRKLKPFVLLMMGLFLSAGAICSFATEISDTKNTISQQEGPLFILGSGSLTPCGESALKSMKLAIAHGVSSHFSEAAEEFIEKGDDASFEKLLKEFIEELLGGELRQELSKKYPELVSPVDAKEILKTIKEKADCHDLVAFFPTHPSYLALKEALANYRKLYKTTQEKGGQELSLTLTKTYKKGDHGPEIKDLRKYLQSQHFLPQDASITEEFNEEVEEAVKKFQEYHSLEKDGVIGPATRHALSLSLSLKDRIDLIKLNLKRWRIMLPKELPSRLVIVNVGSYTAEAIQENKRRLFMKAVVGMPSRKTPLFKAPMFQVIFNPWWGVPHSIATKDKLRKIKNDPDYISRSGYSITDESGLSVDPFSVNWEDFFEGYFPFHLRQHPGRGNALGQIKFDIKNRHTIYLHDTNEKGLFQKMSRARSSGCVRLESPIALANWIFEGEKFGSSEEVTKAIDSGATRAIPIKDSISVYFVYITVWADDEGQVHFSDDPYKWDHVKKPSR